MRQSLRSAENNRAQHCMMPRNRPERDVIRENRLAGPAMLALPLHDHG